MKGPFTKRLLLGLGLGVLLGSCQPVQYHARDDGLTALHHVFKTPPSNDAERTYIPLRKEHKIETMIIEDDPPSSLSSFPVASSLLSLFSAARPSSPYAVLTEKDYELNPLESPAEKPASLETLLTLPYVPIYSTALPPVSLAPYLLTERREYRLDRAYFPSREEERSALEEGWFVHDLKPRDNRDKDFEERSMPLGKLGHALKRLLEKSNHSFGQVLRGFSGVADGPTRYLFGEHWKSKFNLRVGTKKAGMYLTLKPLDDFKFTLGYETSANIGGKEGDAAFFLTFEHTIGPDEQSH